MLDRGNLFASLFVVVLSGWVMKQAYTMGLGTFHSPGPGFMVFIASLLLGLLALLALFKSLMRRQEASQIAPARKRWGRVAWVFLLLAGYVLLLNRAGYLLVTVVTLFLLFTVLQEGKKRWLSAAIMAAVTSGVTYLVFSVWFKLQLPTGWISWW
jgi:hypothetical protein